MSELFHFNNLLVTFQLHFSLPAMSLINNCTFERSMGHQILHQCYVQIPKESGHGWGQKVRGSEAHLADSY